MIERPFNEKFSKLPQYGPAINFFMKNFYRIRKIREMELDLCVPEKDMKSTKLFRYLEKWRTKKTEELKNHE